MGNLGLWDLLTLIDAENLGKDKAVLILESFAQAVSSATALNYSQPTKETYGIIFIDIKNSTRLLNNYSFAEKVFEFLAKAFEEFNWLHPKFKLVGDGILFLSPIIPYDDEVIILQESYEKLRRITNVDFRIVGGRENLYCIEFETDQGILKECVGCPISYLVKKSKEVDTYEWFDEITREKCRELLNS